MGKAREQGDVETRWCWLRVDHPRHRRGRSL